MTALAICGSVYLWAVVSGSKDQDGVLGALEQKNNDPFPTEPVFPLNDTSFSVSERRLSSEAYRNPVSGIPQSHAWSRYAAPRLLDRRSSALTEKLV